jgi:SAM-dependent methyltransferase
VRRLLAAILLVSSAAIGYEILLMRLLSIVQWHHFAWMIISLALLGYGTSGTAIALLKARVEQQFELAFAVSALLCSVSMLLAFAAGQRVPFNALEIIWEPVQFLNLALLTLVFLVPFLFAAFCIGLALSCRGDMIHRIYFVDLFGAGCGAAGVIALLFTMQPGSVLIVLAVLPVAASVLLSQGRPIRHRLTTLQLLWTVALVIATMTNWPGLRISPYKGLSQALQVVDASVLEQVSSPLGLVTVVDSPTVPVRHAPGMSFNSRHVPPQQLAVFTDADALSAITRYDGNPESIAYLGDTTAALPFVLLQSPEVLVLGSGAGEDVLRALFHGAHRVDAVELDPAMIELVRNSPGTISSTVYDDPRVTVHIAEARNFVARGEHDYDLIQLGLLDSFAASGAGVQALNESYIYTVEALREYLGHLKPGGLLAITRWNKLPERDNVKLVLTAFEALEQSGVDDPGRQLVIIRSWNTTTLVARNGSFTGDEIGRTREFARRNSFDVSYFPGISDEQVNRYNILDADHVYAAARAVVDGIGDDFARRYKYVVEPATDDRPYFFHFFRWETFGEVLALRKAGGGGLIEWGYLVLLATLVQALLIGALLILLPLVRVKRDWPPGTSLRWGGYFLLLGLAFLFVEMAFIQKFILFLGHPLYSVAVVLSGFLVFAGAGSALSARFRKDTETVSPIIVVVAAIVILAIVYVLLLPGVFDFCLGFPDWIRVGIAVALIAPLALLMGMPFPLGLSRISEQTGAFVPWAWGINGFASVVSAVLATLVAIEFGFSVVILVALALYAVAALLYR